MPIRSTISGKNSDEKPTPTISESEERAVGVSTSELAALYVLDGVKGFGPQKFKQLYVEGLNVRTLLDNPESLSLKGKRGDSFRSQLAQITDVERVNSFKRACRQINAAHKLGALILTYSSPSYPRRVFDSNNPIPILYVRGNVGVLTEPQAIACVGSRKIRNPFLQRHKEFVETACSVGFTIASGFALGADSVGHSMARSVGGKTICCMPGGLDRPFPPENKDLWTDFLSYNGAAFVSEFPFGTRASSLTLRKRNKLIVAFSQGVLISQSAVGGGAMNAYRFAREQGKPVATFLPEGDKTRRDESDDAVRLGSDTLSSDTSGNRLIADECREGDVVFSATGSLSEEYRRWLFRLSSSI
jgi:DNA protecting protein DprA